MVKKYSSGVNNDAFCRILMASNLINKRGIAKFLTTNTEIKRKFESFKDIWEASSQEFIDVYYK